MTYILTSVATASNAAALGVTVDSDRNGLLQDIFGDEHSEDIAGLPVSSAIALVGNDAEGKQ